MSTTAATVTARKSHPCGDSLCETTIAPGEEYARHVAFPGDEVNQTGRPWVLRLCHTCQTQYGRTMPAKRNGGRR